MSRPMSDPTRMLAPVRTLFRGLVVCSVVAVSACLANSPPMVRADPIAATALVLKVVDGDTVDIVDDARGRLRIRLLGIDTPETKKPGYTVGCWGPEASEFAKDTLLGRRVAFVTDSTQGMYDRYGRTLAYLDKADGWDYSVEAARAGAAHSYVYHNKPAARAEEIAAAEQEAKAAGRGLWGPPCFGVTASVPR
jgi:micrococcal nuclease